MRLLCHGAVLAILAVVALLPAVQLRGELTRALVQAHPAVLDGRELLEHPAIPPGAHLIAEDETLNYVLVKQPDRLAQLTRIPELDLRVVHLLRDPRGWCNSRRKHSNKDWRRRRKASPTSSRPR